MKNAVEAVCLAVKLLIKLILILFIALGAVIKYHAEYFCHQHFEYIENVLKEIEWDCAFAWGEVKTESVILKCKVFGGGK